MVERSPACAALVTATAEGVRLDAADLVVTAPAGIMLAELDAILSGAGAWLALDPPGPPRTLGETLGGGAAGPLAAGYGAPRDQVIGLAFRAGAGTLVRTGGRVVKNVAGFDLAKLVVGGHGAFGVIEEVHLRLRARPEGDRTRLWTGSRDAIAAAAARVMNGGATPSAFEVASPGVFSASRDEWAMAVRAMGTGVGVDEELEITAALAGDGLTQMPDVQDAWSGWTVAVGAWPVRVRIGADPSRWNDAVALAIAAGACEFTVTVPRGTVRARFDGDAPDRLRSLRLAAAARGWPTTLEAASARTLRDVGIWGAMPAGTLRIAKALRSALGPDGTQDIPLWAAS